MCETHVVSLVPGSDDYLGTPHGLVLEGEREGEGEGESQHN